MSRSRRENNLRRKQAEKNARRQREGHRRFEMALKEHRNKAREAQLPPDVYAFAQALGLR